jgi:hypothetical protein
MKSAPRWFQYTDLSGTLILLVWNCLVRENISESNVSRHLVTVKAVCSCFQLGKLRYHAPNLVKAFAVNYSRIKKGWPNCEYCRKHFCKVKVAPSGMPNKEFDVLILEDETNTSSRNLEKQLPCSAAPHSRRTDTTGVMCAVQLVTESDAVRTVTVMSRAQPVYIDVSVRVSEIPLYKVLWKRWRLPHSRTSSSNSALLCLCLSLTLSLSLSL